MSRGSKPGERRGGRTKGVPNKTTQLAKDIIALAAEQLGGTAGLVKWVQSDPQNERVFWGQIYTKLLPLQIGGDPANPIEFKSVGARELIAERIAGIAAGARAADDPVGPQSAGS